MATVLSPFVTWDSRPTSDARFNVMLTSVPFLIGDVEFGGILSTLEHADASLEPLSRATYLDPHEYGYHLDVGGRVDDDRSALGPIDGSAAGDMEA